ncbi:MAG: glycosyltransferase family 4 protein, partial [Calditrichaeota bacterium]|nr:glycosyltransferase family 4 protein [Calditrichota bacterium]
RELLPIKKSEKIILYQGLIHPARGTDVLLETMKYIDNAVLIFIGPGDYIEELRKKAIYHPKKEQIFILDPVPVNELPNFTASADIGVALIQNECLNYYFMLPNKLFEFLVAGLPVVFSDFPEVRKIIQRHDVGKVVDETNPHKIAEAIHAILSDDNVRQEMSLKAQRTIRDYYNWEIEEKKLYKIYSNIAKKKIFIEFHV